MEPAVAAVLDRAVFPGFTARDVFGNSPEPGEVSNRGERQHLRLSPVFTAGGIPDSRRRCDGPRLEKTPSKWYHESQEE